MSLDAAFAIAPGRPGATCKPATAHGTSSAGAESLATIGGTPLAITCTTTCPNVSDSDGKTNTSAEAKAEASSTPRRTR